MSFSFENRALSAYAIPAAFLLAQFTGTRGAMRAKGLDNNANPRGKSLGSLTPSTRLRGAKLLRQSVSQLPKKRESLRVARLLE